MATRKKAAKKAKAGGVAPVAQERLLGTVHQVWLAGLGAVSMAQRGGSKLLEDLVEEGARVHVRTSKATDEAVRALMANAQSAIRGRVEDVRGKATDAFENLEKMFQTRVHQALRQLGVPSAEEVAGLAKRVDALNANIGRLTRGKRGGGRKPRARAHDGGKTMAPPAPTA